MVSFPLPTASGPTAYRGTLPVLVAVHGGPCPPTRVLLQVSRPWRAQLADALTQSREQLSRDGYALDPWSMPE